MNINKFELLKELIEELKDSDLGFGIKSCEEYDGGFRIYFVKNRE